MPNRRSVLAAMLLMLLAGCSSVALTNAWLSPNRHGAPFRRILLVGISPEEGPRRTFEDVFANALQAYGVEAVKLYDNRPELGQLSEDKLQALVRGTGVEAVLITRQLRRDQRIQSSAGMPMFGFYGFYRYAWLDYQPPTVYAYDVAVLETDLWSARDDQLVWSGTTEASRPNDIARSSLDFAKVVSRALAQQGLLPRREPLGAPG